jgi:hypothetical protein
MLAVLSSAKASVTDACAHIKAHPKHTLVSASKVIIGVAFCAIGYQLARNVNPVVREVAINCISSAGIQRSRDALYGSTAAISTFLLGLYIAKQAFNPIRKELPPRPPSR